MFGTVLEDYEDVAEKCLLVLLEGARILGFSTSGPYRDDSCPELGEVYGLYLHPEVWGRGHARTLLDASEI